MFPSYRNILLWTVTIVSASVDHRNGDLDTYTRKMKKGVADRIGGSPKKKHVSWSTSASLRLLVRRIGRYLNKGRYSHGVKPCNPVHLVVVLEDDEGLKKLMASVTIIYGGMLQKINPVLLPKKNENVAEKGPTKSSA
ncbi:hypothetical protein M9H77_29770 [Catharanthus roseus]|uniref:Uncharacterized protein n=1 Tax=Catharanthus roseus TaxID=4058 RepID=A0ACB9ZZL1_CATRO|nr:hypothetical protein M9H77_29770 [Catharanthus roseus]